jgi:mRNA-degrading endonuclease RelE of RelBE toxin-antitoxin system
MYSLLFSSSWKKDIRKIDEQFVRRINEKVFKLAENPFPRGCEDVRVPGLTRIRIGAYRAVYAVNTAKKIVHCLKVVTKDDETYTF